METRKRWGIVHVAVIFALLTIGTAAATFYFEKKEKNATIIAIAQHFGSGQGLSNTVGSAPGPGASLSDALSNDLNTQYGTLLQKGTFTSAERDQMLSDLANKYVSDPAVVPVISLTDLNVQASTSLSSYIQLLAVILSQSGQVKEYELDVFANTVQSRTTTGTPKLIADADLYQHIAAAILAMEVPAAVAPQHLEVVKSVGALSKAVALMGSWNGDPIEGLIYVDTFNKAQAYSQSSINTLIAAVQKLQQKT